MSQLADQTGRGNRHKVFGPNRANVWLHTVHARDGQSLKLGLSIANAQGLGRMVLSEVGRRRLPQARQTYQAGGLVDLGQMGLSVQGLASGQQLLPRPGHRPSSRIRLLSGRSRSPNRVILGNPLTGRQRACLNTGHILTMPMCPPS
jgi:hypothetical protein